MSSSARKILSERVEHNFSQAAFSYEHTAKIQRAAAKRLFDFMRANFPADFSPNAILELGAGTGFFTKLLLPNYPGTKILITDISDEMLFVCRRKIASMTGCKEQWMIEFKMLDFNEEFDLPQDCSLLISALSFQWAEDFPNLITRIYRKLPQNAFLCFSILTDGSLLEFRKLFEATSLEYPVPHHCSISEIRRICSAFSDIKVESYSLQSAHSGIIPFLKSLKNIGAVNPGISRIKAGRMKKIIRSAPEGEFTVTYQLANLLCRK